MADSKADAAQIDAQSKALSDAIAQADADKGKNLDANGDEKPAAKSGGKSGGTQKYRVLTGAATIRSQGRNQATRVDHGKIVELDAGDEDTQRLVDLKAIELASEPYKGRVTGFGLSRAANELAQESQPVQHHDGSPESVVGEGETASVLDGGLKETSYKTA